MTDHRTGPTPPPSPTTRSEKYRRAKSRVVFIPFDAGESVAGTAELAAMLWVGERRRRWDSLAERVVERKKERIGNSETWPGINNRGLDCEDPRGSEG